MKIDLSYTDLSSISYEFGDLTQAESLDLSFCNLTSCDLKKLQFYVSNMKNLKCLLLEGNDFGENLNEFKLFINSLNELNNLAVLNLNKTSIDSEVAEQILSFITFKRILWVGLFENEKISYSLLAKIARQLERNIKIFKEEEIVKNDLFIREQELQKMNQKAEEKSQNESKFLQEVGSAAENLSAQLQNSLKEEVMKNAQILESLKEEAYAKQQKFADRLEAAKKKKKKKAK